MSPAITAGQLKRLADRMAHLNAARDIPTGELYRSIAEDQYNKVRQEFQAAVDAALAAAETPTVAQPVAALMRSRSVTTWPHLSVDGKTHYSEWGDWLPTTYKHAKAVTDPSRNADPVCYEMQPLYAEAPTVAQPAQEPVRVEAVATVQAGEDGLYLDWLIEGGICALEEGCALVVPSRPITDDLGSGEVYTAPPQPVALTDEQIDALALAPGDYRTFARAIERATIQPASCGQLREKCV